MFVSTYVPSERGCESDVEYVCACVCGCMLPILETPPLFMSSVSLGANQLLGKTLMTIMKLISNLLERPKSRHSGQSMDWTSFSITY